MDVLQQLRKLTCVGSSFALARYISRKLVENLPTQKT